MSGKHDPLAFSKAMGIFKEKLKQTNPGALEMLEAPSVGFNYTSEAFIYCFFNQDRNSFERLSKSPLIDFLTKATEMIEFDLKLKIERFGNPT